MLKIFTITSLLAPTFFLNILHFVRWFSRRKSRTSRRCDCMKTWALCETSDSSATTWTEWTLFVSNCGCDEITNRAQKDLFNPLPPHNYLPPTWMSWTLVGGNQSVDLTSLCECFLVKRDEKSKRVYLPSHLVNWDLFWITCSCFQCDNLPCFTRKARSKMYCYD